MAETFLERLAHAGNTKDADLAASLCSVDVVVDDHGSGDVLQGRDALRELFGGIFRVIPDISFERIGEPLFSADRTTMSARWRISGTRLDGTAFDVQTVDFYRFVDGLAADYSIYVRDTEWLGRQMP